MHPYDQDLPSYYPRLTRQNLIIYPLRLLRENKTKQDNRISNWINYANLTALKSYLNYLMVCVRCNLKTSCLHCFVYDKTTSASCLFNVPWTFLIHVSSVPTFVEIPGPKCFLDSCPTAKARGKS